ncbi:MAG: hypothetical protein ACREQD_15585, partial [Candidatus Binataceae bacterium]
NIDSLLMDPNNNTFNNNDCGNNLVAGRVGEEPANFAFVTKSGNSVAPADPLTGLGAQVVVTKDVFLMNAGDTLEVRIGDNPGADPNGGLEVIIRDLTTGKSGSMIASIANGFAQVNFAPSASTCTETPYAFHPMYGTSGVHTRVPWTAHSFNVAFSDEIGHFEYCTDVDPITGTCLSGDRLDDFFCLAPSQSSKIKIGGCTFDDLNFDSPSYLLDWPGTLSDAAQDAKLHAQPIRLNGAFIGASDGATHQFDAVAFETDQPSVEAGFGYPCDPTTGAGCVNPPPGAAFYPVYTTTTDANLGCVWQLGGTSIPNTVQSYGDSTAEYGAILGLEYAGLGGASLFFNDFQQALSSNPCAVAMPALSPSLS